ncbi:hypothetical protein [Mucilaginibacter sp.]|uniref:hypothetical protein n=1 Tax=Mucilaginibacter sp. TaxID=1882438 RepID=UPI003D09AF00
MLADELYELRLLIERLDKPCLDTCPGLQSRLALPGKAMLAACAQVKVAWSAAVFSAASDEQLARYFKFHLQGIRKLSDTLQHLRTGKAEMALFDAHLTSLDAMLLSLVDQLFTFHADFFEPDAIAPVSYRNRLIKALLPEIAAVKGILMHPLIDQELSDGISYYLEEMTANDGAAYSYRALFYFENWIKALSSTRLEQLSGTLNERLLRLLAELEFNELAFFNYCIRHVSAEFNLPDPGEKLTALCAEESLWNGIAPAKSCYDPEWPALTVLMKGWLSEEIAIVKNRACVFQGQKEESMPVKLSLDLSVAHLACLVRLFVKEHLLPEENLRMTFKFLAGHCRTKRQPVISPGSLSKEYYSVSQVTAANVRDLLQRMVKRIDRDFFPVWLATGTAIGVCLSMH